MKPGAGVLRLRSKGGVKGPGQRGWRVQSPEELGEAQPQHGWRSEEGVKQAGQRRACPCEVVLLGRHLAWPRGACPRPQLPSLSPRGPTAYLRSPTWSFPSGFPFDFTGIWEDEGKLAGPARATRQPLTVPRPRDALAQGMRRERSAPLSP